MSWRMSTRRAAGENLFGHAGENRAGSDGVDVVRPALPLGGKGFNEAHNAGFGNAVRGEVWTRTGRAPAGKANHFGAVW